MGGLPLPQGGVTNFIRRFCQKFNSGQIEVIDLYPNSNKIQLDNIVVHTSKTNRLLCFIKMIVYVNISRPVDVFFNFSTIYSLFFLLLVPNLSNKKWFLLLHHGELKTQYLTLPRFAKILLKCSLKRFIRIGTLSEPQRKFYEDIGISNDYLLSVRAYIPEKILVDRRFQRELSVLFPPGRKKIVVASGYPTNIYNHSWLFDAHERRGRDFNIVFCFYGDDSDGLKAEFVRRASQCDSIHIFFDLSPQGFLNVLNFCDIYVRPNSVDSFGIGHAEADSLGKVVIASNACVRVPRAHTFPLANCMAFNALLDKAISGQIGPREIQSSADEGVSRFEDFFDI